MLSKCLKDPPPPYKRSNSRKRKLACSISASKALEESRLDNPYEGARWVCVLSAGAGAFRTAYPPPLRAVRTRISLSPDGEALHNKDFPLGWNRQASPQDTWPGNKAEARPRRALWALPSCTLRDRAAIDPAARQGALRQERHGIPPHRTPR